jgi:hypothetical protein
VIFHISQQVVIVHIDNVSIFNEFDDKFGKLNKDCWTCMFNVECIVKPSILKTILHIDAISKALVFVKSEDTSLFYNHKNFAEL